MSIELFEFLVSKKEKHAGKCVPDKEKEFSEYIRR